MKKYLKITIVFALTVVIVATMCILPTFAAFVEETVTITDKSQLEVGVTYTTLNFAVVGGNSLGGDFTPPTELNCGGTVRCYDSVDEEYESKGVTGLKFQMTKPLQYDAQFRYSYDSAYYTFGKLNGDFRYKVDLQEMTFPTGNLTVVSFALTDIILDADWVTFIDGISSPDNFSATYTNLVEVPDPPSPTDSITGIFTNISGWIVTAIGNTVPMFYNAQAAELTILGVLAVVGLAIAVIFLLINVIKRFIQFRT